MDDVRLGLAFRAARVNRKWRQAGLARLAAVSPSTISRIEHGQLDQTRVRDLRAVSVRLGLKLDISARWSGGELDRLLSRDHSALGECLAIFIASCEGWTCAAEITFALAGERGVIDLLAWHEASRTLIVIELKTEIVDVDELIGTLDRKKRLAAKVAADRGWHAGRIAAWLIVADSRTNRRRIYAHRQLLRTLLPSDGRSLRSVFADPTSSLTSGIAFWSYARSGGVRRVVAGRQRVRKPATDRTALVPRSGSHTT